MMRIKSIRTKFVFTLITLCAFSIFLSTDTRFGQRVSPYQHADLHPSSLHTREFNQKTEPQPLRVAEITATKGAKKEHVPLDPTITAMLERTLVKPKNIVATQIYYHGKPKTLRIDYARLNIQWQKENANTSGLSEWGLPLDNSTMHPYPEYDYLALETFWAHAKASSELSSWTQDELLRSLTDMLAEDARVDFVSPVFFDNAEHPMSMSPNVLIGFKDEVMSDARIDLINTLASLEDAEYLGVDDFSDVLLYTNEKNGYRLLDAVNALALTEGVAFAEPDLTFSGNQGTTPGDAMLIPNDPLFTSSGSWGLHNTGQSGGTVDFDMDAPEAWDIEVGNSSVIVVVIDSGIEESHPDLNQWTGNGADFTPDNNPRGAPVTIYDRHGTAVAGCVAGVHNNNLGAAGIAPGVEVASARPHWNGNSSGSFWTSSSAVVNAINWSQSIGAKVTVNSNGYGFTSAAVESAYQSTLNAGVLHFASSGNSGTSTIGYPARISSVHAVGATNRSGGKASFSQWGTGQAFMAPGQAVYTTDITGSGGYATGDYTTVNGTSFSCPYAGGVAALIFSYNSSLTPAEVTAAMQTGCVDMGQAGYDTTYGYGHLNAYNSLAAIGLTFTAAAIQDEITLRWSDPTELGMSNTTVYIRVSTSGYPIDQNDGTQIYAGTSSEYVHTGLSGGQTYYYRIWGNDGNSYASFLASDTATGRVLDANDYTLMAHNGSGTVVTWNMNNVTRLANKTEKSTAPGSGWNILARIDYDDDGYDDLFLQNPTTGQLRIWHMKGAALATNTLLPYTLPTSTGYYFAAMGDMDGDGNVDIVWQHATANVLAYWYMDGNTRTSAVTINNAPSRSSGFYVKGINDFDGDGNADLLWHHTNGAIALWYMNNTTTLRTAMITESLAASSGWAIYGTGDFDDDGAADILWYHPASGSTCVWHMWNTLRLNYAVPAQQFNGSLIPQYNYLSSPDMTPGAATLAATDLYWHHTTGYMMHWDMTGTTKLDTNIFADTLARSNAGWELKFMRDVNNDGNLDKVWYHPSGHLAVWHMDGLSRTSSAAYAYSIPSAASGWQLVGYADMDGDNNDDLVWHHNTASVIAYWYMDGMTRLSTAAITSGVPSSASGWHIKGINDFNGDNNNDILWHHTSGPVVAWHMNDTTKLGHAASNVSVPTSSGWSIYGTGDYNGDSHTDILWWHATNGQILYWYMNGMTQDSYAVSSDNLPLNSGWKMVPH